MQRMGAGYKRANKVLGSLSMGLWPECDKVKAVAVCFLSRGAPPVWQNAKASYECGYVLIGLESAPYRPLRTIPTTLGFRGSQTATRTTTTRTIRTGCCPPGGDLEAHT